MNREEKKAFEMLAKDGPEKTLANLQSKVSENESFMQDLEKDTNDLKSMINIIEQFRGIRSIEKPTQKTTKSTRSVGMNHEIKEFFNNSKNSKSVKTVFNHLKNKGFKTSRHSVATALSILANEGELERSGRGMYKVKKESNVAEISKVDSVRGRNGAQEKVLTYLQSKPHAVSTKDVQSFLEKNGYDNVVQTCGNALYFLKQKGEIVNPSRGFYRAKSTMQSLHNKVVTLDTVKKCFDTRKELSSEQLKEYLVDSGRMSYTQLHTKLKKLVDDKYITRVERGVYRLKE